VSTQYAAVSSTFDLVN